ncbi:calcium/proton exchanger [Cyphellophora europaea CBS 101466]|uniref:Calcium/proton exchanger n=1 Tax=Cyphellophora europaea (strain CBS 101466) TaxID=1220924 RepID=W2RLP6_CYPE1|nr:calcium/proton exchanger [Cyphellophora europaea CBS 101466]ETN37421.1 calcium/proton exchanger [Cyphellophora europaea CBS 101466]
MHRIKNHAHSSAKTHRFNPWSKDPGVATAAGLPPTANGDGEPEKSTTKVPLTRRFTKNLRTIFLRSWINILLVFVPAGIAVHFANVDPNVVFALNAIAVIPLAGLLTFATECVAAKLGPTLGALLNVSFGNAVELIIFIIALVKNEIRVVQAALIGSILANLLLILGMAFVVGGLQYREQVYDSLVTQMSAALLALAVLSLLIPTAFHASFNDLDMADERVLKLSRGTSVILLIMYLLYLAFQLKSHSYLYRGTPQHVIDAQTQPGIGPGILARMNSSSSSTSSSTSISSATGSQRRVKRKLRISKLGKRRSPEVTPDEEGWTEEKAEQSNQKTKEQTNNPTKGKEVALEPAAATASGTSARPKMGLKQFSFIPAPPVFRSQDNSLQRSYSDYPIRRLRSDPRQWKSDNITHSPTMMSYNEKHSEQQPETEEPELTKMASIVLLLCSTGLVALCAEFMVGSIEHLVENSPLSEAFVGLIILPIVGNAAEHVTAVTVAAKNKLDLSLGVALGSSIQIALFVTPLVVILGWILDKEMSLYFNLFETVTIFVSTFVVNFLVLDGRSNYLEGALLCACYVIIAVGAYLFPDSESQSPSTAGPGGG